MADLSFQNNVPDPVLSAAELPTFKFELEKLKGKVLGNSFGKEATVEQLPISKGLAGVSMHLSSWIAGNPVDVLVTNFNQPESVIRKFPHKDVFIAPSE
jgi:hypothetical protein